LVIEVIFTRRSFNKVGFSFWSIVQTAHSSEIFCTFVISFLTTMAKGNGKSPTSGNGQEKPQPAYFKSVTIEDVKCFKGKHTIDLSDGNGKPAQWTVILGNNNTGKTTILKCLAGLAPMGFSFYISVGESNAGLSFKFGSEDIEVGGITATAAIETLNGGSSQSEGYLWGDHTIEGSIFPHPSIKENLIIYSYGASRKMSKKSLVESQSEDIHANLFENADLANVEDWLLNLFLAEKLGQVEAKTPLEIAKNLLSSGLLPDVMEVNLNSREAGAGFINFVEFFTDFGWIRLRDLGYGYQTMIAWVLDLVKRMVERYPNSSNPLAEPAIVLVDEIDLHLHPDWQRKIIAHLTKYFPNTQFIVTAHSPLVVQSAEEVNIVILKKEGESVHIEQPKIRSFRGWTVEEILTDLMDLEGQTMSQTYLGLMEQFDDALDSDDFEKAENAFQKLDKILHPVSHQRKLLQLQMTSLSPANAV